MENVVVTVKSSSNRLKHTTAKLPLPLSLQFHVDFVIKWQPWKQNLLFKLRTGRTKAETTWASQILFHQCAALRGGSTQCTFQANKGALLLPLTLLASPLDRHLGPFLLPSCSGAWILTLRPAADCCKSFWCCVHSFLLPGLNVASFLTTVALTWWSQALAAPFPRGYRCLCLRNFLSLTSSHT